MARHRPWTLLASDPPCWRVRCRDERGNLCEVLIEIDGDGVVLRQATGRSLTFSPLDLGRLRIALREALVTYSEEASRVRSS